MPSRRPEDAPGAADAYAEIAADFHTSLTRIAFLTTATLVMRPLGAFLFGIWTDHSGRRLPLIVDVCLYSTVGFLCASGPSYATLLAPRLLYGIGMGGEWGLAALALRRRTPRTPPRCPERRPRPSALGTADEEPIGRPPGGHYAGSLARRSRRTVDRSSVQQPGRSAVRNRRARSADAPAPVARMATIPASETAGWTFTTSARAIFVPTKTSTIASEGFR